MAKSKAFRVTWSKTGMKPTFGDILSYDRFSLCDLSDYEALIGVPNFGYLLNSEEIPAVREVFDIIWKLLDGVAIDDFRSILIGDESEEDREYSLDFAKRKDCTECQSVLMVLKKRNATGIDEQIKFIDLWHDCQIEIPGFCVLSIEDYYLNIDTKGAAHSSARDDLQPYYVVNNLLSGLARGDFSLLPEL